MDIASVAQQVIANDSTGSQAVENPKGTLGKDDFLKLLVAQLKNQDPLNPLDNDQFIQENTQFSQLEQATNANKTLQSISGGLNNSDKSYAATYLGKYITTDSEGIKVAGSKIDPVSFNMPISARVQASVINSKGQTVATIDLGNMTKGNQTFRWDGKDDKGNSVSNGTYSVVLSAIDNSGASIPIERNAGKVTAVRFNSSGAVLVTNLNNQVKLNDVKSVFEGA